MKQLLLAATTAIEPEWRPDCREYANGEWLFLGKWPVGGINYDSLVSRERKDKYRATCQLPGICSNLGLHATPAMAKERVEAAVTSWLVNSGMVKSEQ